jgi:glycosyltransferase involved in cell wall biosynthesis
MLKIGFDAKRLFNNATGLGGYSRSIVKGMMERFPDNEYSLFTPGLKNTVETSFFHGERFTVVTPSGIPGALWRTFRLKSAIEKRGLDLYHGLSNELPAGMGESQVCGVVTIHDLIFRFHPEDYPWIDRLVYEKKFRHACESARRIVAISESTKHDLVSQYGVPEEKIAVVYQCCDDRFRKSVTEEEIEAALSRYALPPKFLLYVGTINRRKNLLALAQAMRLVRNDMKLPLVVVGRGKLYKQEVADYIERNDLTERIIFAPPIASDDLPAVYRRATALLFPSKYEGFGLPIVEALTCGVPVITSDVSSLPEAAGPGAHYIDPDKPESIAEGIIKIVSSPDYAKNLAEEGNRYVQRFNIKEISEQLMKVYDEAINQKR